MNHYCFILVENLPLDRVARHLLDKDYTGAAIVCPREINFVLIGGGALIRQQDLGPFRVSYGRIPKHRPLSLWRPRMEPQQNLAHLLQLTPI